MVGYGCLDTKVLPVHRTEVCMHAREQVKHVVLFKFKKDVSEEKKEELIGMYKGLTKVLDIMKEFEWGEDISIEDLHKGYTHCFITSLESTAARDQYVEAPAHVEYVSELKPCLEEVLVIDFLSTKVK